ncbi:MAG: dihydrolipoyl dehydrogenase family protein [Nitrososphaera sp.]|uniref:dihydrolipoyl dehydrogenase family protein n=1 Tax=Nitrososphaera sp. TaxID=1971748 RepID=UPI003D6DFB60
MQKFDLAVIGSGSGLDVANAAAQHGMKVAVIEKSRMGGTCLNRGCIPSKLLIHSADVAEIIKSAGLFGIKVEKFSIDYASIVKRTTGIVDDDSDGIKNAFAGIDNPRLFEIECRFTGKKTISAGDETISADKILIASGTRPAIPKIMGLDGSGYITSDEALRLQKQPHSLTIIGGGFIAAELAHFFGALGTEINIIERGDFMLKREDEDVSKKFTEVFSRKYGVHLGYSAESVGKKNGMFHVVAKNFAGETLELDSDQLLIATGRTPNSDTLALEKTGVKTDKKGFIVVDDYLETNVKGIFALGDAVGRYQFKHSANMEAQYAFNNITHSRKVPADYAAMPHAIFSSPQVAGAGYTEKELKEKGTPYKKAVYNYMDTAMGQAIEDRDGFVKLLVSNDGKILGCHILGSHASILIHEVLVAMKAGDGTHGSIARTVHIHPALSEVVAEAAYAVE